MAELYYKQGGFYTGNESEDELQATAHELDEFKKQYAAMADEKKVRLPIWLREHLEQK